MNADLLVAFFIIWSIVIAGCYILLFLLADPKAPQKMQRAWNGVKEFWFLIWVVLCFLVMIMGSRKRDSKHDSWEDNMYY